MTTRQVVALAAAVPLLVGVTAADAATRKKKKRPPVKVPVCNVIPDLRDDATGNGTGMVATPNDPSLDILSADVATSATWVTAVIRLASVDPNPTSSPTGRAYDVSFLAHGEVVTVRALVSPAGEVWYGGKGQGAVDSVKKEIRIHVPVADIGIPLKPNDRLTELKAASWRWVGGTTVSLGLVDNAVGPKPYTSAWPSCVKVGP